MCTHKNTKHLCLTNILGEKNIFFTLHKKSEEIAFTAGTVCSLSLNESSLSDIFQHGRYMINIYVSSIQFVLLSCGVAYFRVHLQFKSSNFVLHIRCTGYVLEKYVKLCTEMIDLWRTTIICAIVRTTFVSYEVSMGTDTVLHLNSAMMGPIQPTAGPLTSFKCKRFAQTNSNKALIKRTLPVSAQNTFIHSRWYYP